MISARVGGTVMLCLPLSLKKGMRGPGLLKLQKAWLRVLSGLTWMVKLKRFKDDPKITGKVHPPPVYKDTSCLSKENQQITMEICPDR